VLLQRSREDNGQETEKPQEKEQERWRARINLDYAWMNYKGLWGRMIARWEKGKAMFRAKKRECVKVPRTSSPRLQGRRNKRRSGRQREGEKVEHIMQSLTQGIALCARTWVKKNRRSSCPLLANYQSIAPSGRPVVRQTFFKWRQSAFVVRLRRRVSRGEKKKRDINPSGQFRAATVRSPPRLYL